MKKLFLLLAMAGFSIVVHAQNKGNLFIIGGGNRSDDLMKQMLNTVGCSNLQLNYEGPLSEL